MRSASLIAHDGLVFANPMSEAAVDSAVAAMRIRPGSMLLETGCGNSEILRRVVRAHPGSSGLGIDNDADVIEQAGLVATEQIRLEVRDAATVSGRFDAVINVAASHVHGGFPGALDALRSFGAEVVLYGEGFWCRPPSPEFLDALGGATEDELSDLAGLRAAIAEAGFSIEHESFASSVDWAFYEEALAENAEQVDRADARAYAKRIRDRRALPNGTDTLGFALFVLHRTEIHANPR